MGSRDAPNIFLRKPTKRFDCSKGKSFLSKPFFQVRHGSFDIKAVSVRDASYFVERDFEVSSINNGETRNVKHLQFLDWPNYGVPDQVEPISKFVQHCHKTAMEIGSANPELVVHCSGGIGRSGTFLAAYGAYDHYLSIGEGDANLAKASSLDLLPIVTTMRHQRHPWMVEGIHQYIMAYEISLFLLSMLK